MNIDIVCMNRSSGQSAESCDVRVTCQYLANSDHEGGLTEDFPFGTAALTLCLNIIQKVQLENMQYPTIVK